MTTTKLLIGVATAACVTAAATAQRKPANEASASEVVSYADLHLDSPADRQRLEWRVRAAASRLCAEDDRAIPAAPYVNSACLRAAIADAHRQVDRALARSKDSRRLAFGR